MSSAERSQLFENIVRLRRAERELPECQDLVLVRASLERELGEAVSRSFAAQVLGVSHTALNRWISAGDVAVVVARDGRRAVPLAALIELYEAVARERSAGHRTRHTLEPTMKRARARARALRPRELVAGARTAGDSHRRAELRSLAYHRALANRLNRRMVDEARHLIWEWRHAEKIDVRYADRWEEILRKPISEIAAILAEDGQPANDLRQNTPFPGMLSEPERRKILAQID